MALKLIFLIVSRAIPLLRLSRREEWWKDGDVHLDVDMSGVTFIGAAGIGVLVAAANGARVAGGSLSLLDVFHLDAIEGLVFVQPAHGGRTRAPPAGP